MTQTEDSRRNRSDFRRPAALPGLELVQATYRDHIFPAHAHPEFVVGTIVAGAERLVVGHRQQILAHGDSLYLHPGEVHANASVGDTALRYLVCYIPDKLLCQALADEEREAVLRFESPFSSRPDRHALVKQAHVRMWTTPDALGQQCAFQELAVGLTDIRAWPACPRVTYEHAKVRRAKDYLHAHFRADASLETLAAVAGLSRYHLLRVFKRQVGLSPAGYRNLLRVMAVRADLLRGTPPAEAAVDAGFADQSHMSRAFKLVMGATPGRYVRP